MSLLTSMFDLEPDVLPPYVEPERVPPPTMLGFAADAAATTVRASRSLVRLVRWAPGAVGDVARLLRSPERDVVLPFTAPRIGVNGRLDGTACHRVVVAAALGRGAVRNAWTSRSTTCSWPSRAVRSGATSSPAAGYPSCPLTAAVPVSLHELQADGLVAEEGNQVSIMFVSLGTNVADPLERVRAVRRSSIGAKRLQAAIGRQASSDAIELIPPLLMRGVAEAYTRPAARSVPPAVLHDAVHEHARPVVPAVHGRRPGRRHAPVATAPCRQRHRARRAQLLRIRRRRPDRVPGHRRRSMGGGRRVPRRHRRDGRRGRDGTDSSQICGGSPDRNSGVDVRATRASACSSAKEISAGSRRYCSSCSRRSRASSGIRGELAASHLGEHEARRRDVVTDVRGSPHTVAIEGVRVLELLEQSCGARGR